MILVYHVSLLGAEKFEDIANAHSAILSYVKMRSTSRMAVALGRSSSENMWVQWYTSRAM